MLLTMTNVTNWEHQLINKLTAFPDIGQPIRTKTPYVLARPTIDDLIEDTNIRMYNLQLLLQAHPRSHRPPSHVQRRLRS